MKEKEINSSLIKAKEINNKMRTFAESLLKQGVEILDTERIDFRGEFSCGKNVSIDINVIFEGNVIVGDNVSIGANCIISNSEIGSYSSIRPFSYIEKAKIGDNAMVGPYARIREGTNLGGHVQIGNFVEIKNTSIQDNGRINHLSFIGDADLDRNVTIGAGTITCNHDGVKHNHTIIGENAYVGSGCNLIAPLKIGKNSTIGAGSTINNNVPNGKLTIARAKQASISNWNKRFNQIKVHGDTNSE
jgi:bifunctional UDP-N-acetylglucosamine pyrophosphorylase / glucosamine-1-phosphate N-acetyltransferase